MYDPKILPNEIFERRQQIGVDNSIRLLTEILHLEEDNKKRADALKYMYLFSKENPSIMEDCFDSLENILISDDNIEIKCETAKLIGKLRLKSGLGPLKWVLNNIKNVPSLRTAVLKAIKKIKFEEDEIDLFINELNSPFNSVKEFIKNQLLSVPPDILIRKLLESLKIESFSNEMKTEIIRILKSDDEELLNSTIIILNLLGSEIHEEIKKLLLTNDFIIKKNAITIVGKLQIKDAIDLLIQDVNFEYSDIDMKFKIIDSVKKIYSKDKNTSYDYLYEFMEKDNDAIKECVAFILGEIGKKEFTEILIEALKNRNLEIKKNVIIALGKIGDVRALNHLLQILKDPDTYWLIKKVAMDAIFNIFQANWYKFKLENNETIKRTFNKVRAEITDYLNQNGNSDFKVKLSIIKFLEQYGDLTSLNALMKRLNDFYRVVRIHASNAIKKIEERFDESENKDG
ncbi:MAG: HEAT repeat domain-containing protein [Promethearchaeota archaeon]